MVRTGIGLLFLASVVAAQGFAGEYVTSEGPMTLEQDGKSVTGTYGHTGNGSVDGTVKKGKLVFEYRVGRVAGTGEFALDGARLTGSWKNARGGGSWYGWKKDPKARKGKSKWSGYWYSSLGILNLEQKGKTVKGTYGSTGLGTVEGEVEGRVLELTWKRIRWSGPATLEMAPDGSAFFGMTKENKPAVWFGQKIDGFKPNVKPKPGQIVGGVSRHPLLYYLRVPKGYRASKHRDAIVMLHGMNWCSKHMVWSFAKFWPKFADKFVIIGIDGPDWQAWSKPDDPRAQYNYVNWMGKSTYKGYPYTDRESPALVAETLQDLREQLKLDRIFLGGHSQGG
ncbi:MAG: alpha/beta hydrolase, partial [Planctomycetota bacterium]|nr:alpha/beta hydrolase [Planctomycetota bacterium]